MTTQEALEVRSALLTLSKLLGITPQQLVNSICLLDKERFAVLKEASTIWNEFEDSSFEGKAELLGYEVVNMKAY